MLNPGARAGLHRELPSTEVHRDGRTSAPRVASSPKVEHPNLPKSEANAREAARQIAVAPGPVHARPDQRLGNLLSLRADPEKMLRDKEDVDGPEPSELDQIETCIEAGDVAEDDRYRPLRGHLTKSDLDEVKRLMRRIHPDRGDEIVAALIDVLLDAIDRRAQRGAVRREMPECWLDMPVYAATCIDDLERARELGFENVIVDRALVDDARRVGLRTICRVRYEGIALEPGTLRALLSDLIRTFDAGFDGIAPVAVDEWFVACPADRLRDVAELLSLFLFVLDPNHAMIESWEDGANALGRALEAEDGATLIRALRGLSRDDRRLIHLCEAPDPERTPLACFLSYAMPCAPVIHLDHGSRLQRELNRRWPELGGTKLQILETGSDQTVAFVKRRTDGRPLLLLANLSGDPAIARLSRSEIKGVAPGLHRAGTRWVDALGSRLHGARKPLVMQRGKDHVDISIPAYGFLIPRHLTFGA